MNKFLEKLARSSFSIVKIMFVASLVGAFILKLFTEQIPLLITAIFFLITGIYVGYVIAYYSIKYLREDDIKKKLPLN
jgi:hypothetical protein